MSTTDYLDVVFDGLRISALSEPEIVDDFSYNETRLVSGETFIQTSTTARFSKTYRCLTEDDVERDAIRLKRGKFADLVIDGITYSGCCIKPPIRFKYLRAPGRWEYDITFVQHTGTLPVPVADELPAIIDGGSA